MKILLWHKWNDGQRVTKLLCSYMYDDLWFVENGHWDLKLDHRTLKGVCIFTGEELEFSKITYTPKNISGDYNAIMNYAEEFVEKYYNNDKGIVEYIDQNLITKEDYNVSQICSEDEIPF